MNKKQRMTRCIWSILTILWMGIIFGFSADTGEESSRISLQTGTAICRIFVPGYQQMDTRKQETMAENIEYPLRKCAHAAEYMILGILLSLSAGKAEDQEKTRQRMAVCMVIAVGYAASDELHQLWSAGRSCRITDVLIDSAGALAGILAVNGVRNIRRNKTPEA